ncbi:MAG: hypothetical protein KAF27_05425 [Porphyrobacter sp.]|nr:hypothetical protein [Porphyrobacter sp.]
MSVNEQEYYAPIAPGSPLARVLDGYDAPDLPADFAERVMAAAEARPAPLPELRRPARVGSRGWRIGQRIAIGIASFGVLATAAAATGLLQQIALPLPSAQTVWASITGTPVAKSAPRLAAAPAPAAEPAARPVVIDGPIDTPEELAEAFRRVEQVRVGRREERRAMVDQRIAREIERRRAAGLRVPTPEEEAALRERIGEEIARREERADQQIAARREAMERKVANGEAVTREDLAGRPQVDPALRDKVRELRAMSPEERREAWRSLPPEQRRTITQELRARRGIPSPSEPSPVPSPAG